MKLINKFKSPNYNSRKFSKIKFIVIHYTWLKNHEEAIKYLCDKNKKVSTHYLISQSGDIYYLVNESKRAWHAGISYWNSYKDINSLSIGIELDYSHYETNNTYNEKMLFSLKQLIRSILKKYKLKSQNILGHSDISPYRKKDPGKNFPWDDLVINKLAYYPKLKLNSKMDATNEWFKFNNLRTKKKVTLFMLSFIGYDTENCIQNRYKFKKLISKYQTRFLQKNISGKMDNITYDFILNHYLNLILTKE